MIRIRQLALAVTFWGLLAVYPAATSAASATSATASPVVLAFGDSLTAGQGVAASDAYPAQLQGLLDAAGYDVRVVNAGVSGETAAEGADRIEAALQQYRPRVVILELGANDGLRGLPTAEIGAHLSAMVAAGRAAGAQVLLAGMQLPPNYGPDYTAAFAAVFPAVAKAQHAALIPFFLAGVGGVAALNQADGIHPNAKGYRIVARTVCEALVGLLGPAP